MANTAEVTTTPIDLWAQWESRLRSESVAAYDRQATPQEAPSVREAFTIQLPHPYLSVVMRDTEDPGQRMGMYHVPAFQDAALQAKAEALYVSTGRPIGYGIRLPPTRSYVPLKQFQDMYARFQARYDTLLTMSEHVNPDLFKFV